MDTKKLRQKILDLAIHGKLVPQDPNDEPASVLLERIKAEKERLIKEGKIKRTKKSAKSSDTPHYGNVPFEVPNNWVWCTLGDLAFYKKGPFGSSLTKSMFVPPSESTYKVYEQKNAIQKDSTLGSYFITKEKFDSLIGFSVLPYDIIVSCAGTIGKTYVLPQDCPKGVINQALMLIRLYCHEIERFYLLYFDYILKEKADKESKGTAIKNIPPFDVLKSFYIPLPPINEQKRILDEVDKWMLLVSSIEDDRIRLQTTIKQTKSKILDLAIHAEITCDNGHYPLGWCKTQLKYIADYVNGRAFKPEEWETNGLPIVRIQNLNDETAPYNKSSKSYEEKYLIHKGDLLFAWAASLGTYVWEKGDAWLNQHIFKVIPFVFMDKLYLYYSLESLIKDFYKESHGSGMVHITKKKFEDIECFVPPFAEQQRIVAKIEELLSILDSIQKSLEA